MARQDADRPLLPSLLDRLADDEPDLTTDPGWARAVSPAKIREGVRRDLEMLLNTNQPRPELFDAPSQIADSVLTYGLPDLTDRSLDDRDEQAKLCDLIRRIVVRHEPRLEDVRVTVRPAADRLSRTIHLQIEAVMRVDPLIERVAFDTVIDSSAGACTVKPTR